MLYWAAVFFVIAIIAAVFGFGGLAAGAAGIAKVLFFLFLILAVLSLIFGRGLERSRETEQGDFSAGGVVSPGGKHRGHGVCP